MIVKKNALYVLIVLKKYSERDGSTESFKEYVKDVYYYIQKSSK
jgi:hypothetical protein